MDIEHLKFPIGRFVEPKDISPEQLSEAIDYIRSFPDFLQKATLGLSSEYLATPYRPGGWTVRQVIHHLADSHMNAFIRFKLALTESNPTIKPYEEQLWAEMKDYQLSTDTSIQLIELLHEKWSKVLDHMDSADFERAYFHPQSQSLVPLKVATLMYEWHSRHHLAHINLPSLSNT
ncbi:YfiT family bacillithiol transferase [Algoriphagus namhaensis]